MAKSSCGSSPTLAKQKKNNGWQVTRFHHFSLIFFSQLAIKRYSHYAISTFEHILNIERMFFQNSLSYLGCNQNLAMDHPLLWQNKAMGDNLQLTSFHHFPSFSLTICNKRVDIAIMQWACLLVLVFGFRFCLFGLKARGVPIPLYSK